MEIKTLEKHIVTSVFKKASEPVGYSFGLQNICAVNRKNNAT